MTDPRLESMIRSLADSVHWPHPPPQFAGEVLARIEAAPTRPRSRALRRLTVAAAIAVVVVGVLVVSPGARRAVADLLDAAGIRIGLVSESAPEAGADLDLGQLTDLSEASADLGYVLRAPGGDEPGPPQSVYRSRDGRVSMVWTGTPALPAATDAGVALLLTQHQGNAGAQIAEKSLGPETAVRSVTVEEQPGLWIEGATHTLTLLDRNGNAIPETMRLAANVLIWEFQGVNHRLETTGDLQTALAVVETLERVQ